MLLLFLVVCFAGRLCTIFGFWLNHLLACLFNLYRYNLGCTEISGNANQQCCIAKIERPCVTPADVDCVMPGIAREVIGRCTALCYTFNNAAPNEHSPAYTLYLPSLSAVYHVHTLTCSDCDLLCRLFCPAIFWQLQLVGSRGWQHQSIHRRQPCRRSICSRVSVVDDAVRRVRVATNRRHLGRKGCAVEGSR